MARFPEIPPETFRRSVVLVSPKGEVFEGAEAVFRSLAETPGHRWPLAAYRRVPCFAAASEAAHHFQEAGARIHEKQKKVPADAARLNLTLRETERALLIPEGLPNRPWYRHAIYAPGQYTGYAAVVIPGVNEAIDKKDAERTEQQIAALAAALSRAAKVLESYR